MERIRLSVKNAQHDVGVLADLQSHHTMGAAWLRLPRAGLVIALVVVAVGVGAWCVSAQQPMQVPAGCPTDTTPLPVPISLTVTLQRPNAPPPDPAWAVPVHFSLHPPGDPNTICWEWDLTLDTSGDWSGNLTLFTGLYDARIKNPHTLRNLKQNVNIPGPTTIDMGTLLEGDASNDNAVKGDDFSILRTVYWTADDRADFDEDGKVTGADFSLLRTNYWKFGDILVP